MKKIIISVAIMLVIILTILSLQGCFTPYPEKGNPDREWRDRERDRQIWEERTDSIDKGVRPSMALSQQSYHLALAC